MPMATEVSDHWPGKEQVVNDVPKVIKELHFGVLYGDTGGGQRIFSNTFADRIKIS